MFKALQAYTDNSSSNHTLTFNAGDILYVLERTNETWWYASDNNGKVGYVLSSYLQPFEKENTEDVILQSIDRAIAAVHASAASDGFSTEQQTVLRKLNKHRQSVVAAAEAKKDSSKRRAPPPPSRSIERVPAPSPPRRSISAKRPAPEKPITDIKAEIPKNDVMKAEVVQKLESLTIENRGFENIIVQQEFNPRIPVQLGQDLMIKLQSECHLTELKSRNVLETLLGVIRENVPELDKVMNEIVETLPDIQATTDPVIDKLRLALANITEIKDDGQQNNWAIEDDEDKISGILYEILEALSSGNKDECITELLYDDCEYVVVLAVYHQMETRMSLRLLVLQILGVICSLKNKLVSTLMASVLPLELVQDITAHTDEIQRVCYSALVLSMLFSTGEPIPLSYYDTFNEKFISFLLDSVENGLSGDTDDRVGDIFVRLILAINLHFLVPFDNLVMKSICSNRCIALSEKIMLLVNRGDDPVKINEHEEPQPPNSVLKFLLDIFSREDTAATFLYTNDLLVLVDIISRNLADLPPGSKTRTDYLDLLLSVLERSTYRENKHRATEILLILERISKEELPQDDEAARDIMEFDKTIVRKILEEHMSCLT